MLSANAELTYRISKTVDGKPEGDPCDSVFIVRSVSAGSAVVASGDDIIELPAPYALVCRLGGLAVTGRETVDTPMGAVETDVYSPEPGICGGSVTAYVSEGIAYRVVKCQLWSRGVNYRETWDLVGIRQ